MLHQDGITLTKKEEGFCSVMLKEAHGLQNNQKEELKRYIQVITSLFQNNSSASKNSSNPS